MRLANGLRQGIISQQRLAAAPCFIYFYLLLLSAKIAEHCDFLILVALVEAVGQGCGGRFVDDAAHCQTGDFTGFLGCLAL